MNIRRGLFTLFFICGLLLIIFTSFGQQKHISLKVYLILIIIARLLKTIVYLKRIRIKLSNLLKKKNIIWYLMKKLKLMKQSYIYIKVVIADSLRISEWKSIAPQGNGLSGYFQKKMCMNIKMKKILLKSYFLMQREIFKQ